MWEPAINTGNEPPTARVYYGTNDGGTNPAAWTNQASVGPQAGVFKAQVAGLAGNTTYYFTTSVSNSAGIAWGGPSKSFTTLPVARVPVIGTRLPAVVTLDAEGQFTWAA